MNESEPKKPSFWQQVLESLKIHQPTSGRAAVRHMHRKSIWDRPRISARPIMRWQHPENKRANARRARQIMRGMLKVSE